MTKVILHGELGEAVGRSQWLLEVKSPREALRAIEAQTKKLYKYLCTKQNGEALFQVVLNGKPSNGIDQLAAPIKTYQTIDIVPVLAGGSSGGLMAIIGVVLVLIAVTILTYGTLTAPATGAYGAGTTAAFAASSPVLFNVAASTLIFGLALVVGGISAMLMNNQTPTIAPSYNFGGSTNTVKQGVPVPVGYGELIVGSATISAGLSAVEINITNSLPA